MPKIPIDYMWANSLALVQMAGMSVAANGLPIVLSIIVYSNIPFRLALLQTLSPLFLII
jgi:hypothetical protein